MLPNFRLVRWKSANLHLGPLKEGERKLEMDVTGERGTERCEMENAGLGDVNRAWGVE